MSWQVLSGDCLEVLSTLDAGSVQTCVTSPPYWGLRDYGTATWEGGDPECDHIGAKKKTRYDYALDTSPIQQGSRTGTDAEVGAWAKECPGCGARRIDSQLGLEPTPEEYVANLVSVFREVRRVLRDDGTVWLNLGDSYASTPTGNRGTKSSLNGAEGEQYAATLDRYTEAKTRRAPIPAGLKPKDLCGIPWRVAFALQADGWWLRSDIIWSKPNPMPESVTDRPTRAHEYVFLLTKSARYFYDVDAIREPHISLEATSRRTVMDNKAALDGSAERVVDLAKRNRLDYFAEGGRNRRSVWEIATKPYSEAHFATFPPKLVEPCILAGSPPKCCGECGAPWERITETEQIAKDRMSGRNWLETSEGSVLGRESDPNCGLSRPTIGRNQTVGWKATCYHADSFAPDDSGSSTVLDPFAGAGTTGLVAALHGRDFIGVELSPEYAEMARDRIRRWEANPNGALEGAPEVAEGQLGLLDEQLVSVARRDADHKRQNTPRNDGDRWNRNDGRGF